MFAHHLACVHPKSATLLSPALVLHFVKRGVSDLPIFVLRLQDAVTEIHQTRSNHNETWREIGCKTSESRSSCSSHQIQISGQNQRSDRSRRRRKTSLESENFVPNSLEVRPCCKNQSCGGKACSKTGQRPICQDQQIRSGTCTRCISKSQ